MATLVDSDFTWIKQNSDASHKETIKAIGLSKGAWQSTLQAIENWHVNGYSVTPSESMKSAIDTAASTTLTNGQAQALWLSWSKWKASNY